MTAPTAEARILKRDVYLSSDLAPDGRGGVASAVGLANLRLAIERLILASPGDVYHRPTYGCGLRDFANKPISDFIGRKIRARIAEQLSQERRIASVTSIGITVRADNILVVNVIVVAAGQNLAVTAQVAP